MNDSPEEYPGGFAFLTGEKNEKLDSGHHFNCNDDTDILQ